MSSADCLRVNSYHVTNFHFANVTSRANFSISDGLVHFLSSFRCPRTNGRSALSFAHLRVKLPLKRQSYSSSRVPIVEDCFCYFYVLSHHTTTLTSLAGSQQTPPSRKTNEHVSLRDLVFHQWGPLFNSLTHVRTNYTRPVSLLTNHHLFNKPRVVTTPFVLQRQRPASSQRATL